jgi:hypothetical protein
MRSLATRLGGQRAACYAAHGANRRTLPRRVGAWGGAAGCGGSAVRGVTRHARRVTGLPGARLAPRFARTRAHARAAPSPPPGPGSSKSPSFAGSGRAALAASRRRAKRSWAGRCAGRAPGRERRCKAMSVAWGPPCARGSRCGRGKATTARARASSHRRRGAARAAEAGVPAGRSASAATRPGQRPGAVENEREELTPRSGARI